MNYQLAALWYAVVMIVLAGIWLYMHSRAVREKQARNEALPKRTFWLAIGLVYLLLAHFGLIVFLAEGLESEAPCEWVLNSSTASMRVEEINASVGDYGEMYHYNAAGTTVTIAASGTWYPIKLYQAGNLNNVTFDSVDDQLSPTYAGVFSVEWALSFAGGLSDEYVVSPFLNNNTEVTRCTQHRKLGTGGDVGSASGSCLLSFAANDTIDLRIKNLDAAASATVVGANVNIARLVGSAAIEGQNSTTTTAYSYVDSCANNTAPASVEAIFITQLWFLWAAILAPIFVLLALLARKVTGWL